ncbi:hypothetical protein [Actinoallomurus rhizosphaericola]|uniref:hypothetical protein n=1 Tax=Actinoallomurus rhizosphaericola TaxID=2952536 RepID=UPI00209056DE|nr:hypothetical protein [Actinoallomurus rhizosphaericola]MCO5991752.1 hypothetical protein [Actinoallomurus rhizosphaericola]
MRRPVRAVPVAAVVCLLAGCGVRPTGVVSAGEAPTATATSLPKARVYFFDDGGLTAVERSVPPWDSQAVFDALLAGPTAQERERGLHTELTADVTIHPIGTKAIFVESRRRLMQQAVDGYQQIFCTARLLPGAPIVRGPSLNPVLIEKLSSAPCQAGDGPAGAGSSGPEGVPTADPTATSPYPGPIGATGAPTVTVPRKRLLSPGNGSPPVPKPTG